MTLVEGYPLYSEFARVARKGPFPKEAVFKREKGVNSRDQATGTTSFVTEESYTLDEVTAMIRELKTAPKSTDAAQATARQQQLKVLMRGFEALGGDRQTLVIKPRAAQATVTGVSGTRARTTTTARPRVS